MKAKSSHCIGCSFCENFLKFKRTFPIQEIFILNKKQTLEKLYIAKKQLQKSALKTTNAMTGCGIKLMTASKNKILNCAHVQTLPRFPELT